MHPAASILRQVVKEARQLNAFCVRGNHDDSALAAYHATQRGVDVDVRPSCSWVVCKVVDLRGDFSTILVVKLTAHIISHTSCFVISHTASMCTGCVEVCDAAGERHGRFCNVIKSEKCSATLLCSHLPLRSCHLHLQAKYAWVTGLSAEDAAWMAELPFTLSIPSRRIIVAHAGVLPGVPLAQQSLADLYTVRDIQAQHAVSLNALLAPRSDALDAEHPVLPITFSIHLPLVQAK